MEVITTTTALLHFCDEMAKQPFVTVDTEFMRESTFWPKLCLIQIAAPGREAIIDPMSEGMDLEPFHRLMAHRSTVKIFHAARQDIEIVFLLAKLVPAPVFDTQVAAMVCGFGESIGYVNLVKSITGVDLDKSSRFTDWSRRPLSKAQLEYALADVTHLRDVYLSLVDTLERTGRRQWVEEEMATLLDPATYETKPDDAWRRLKLRTRSRKSLAVLIELAAWRERLAQAQDVPRGRILRDEALYDIANQLPTETAKLSELRTLSDGFARSSRAKEIIEAVKSGLARDPKSLPEMENGTASQRDTGATVELLKVLLRAAAERHGVAPRMIADSSDLERIAGEANPSVRALEGWRRELFGEDALRLKEGRMALAIRGGQIVAMSVMPREAVGR